VKRSASWLLRGGVFVYLNSSVAGECVLQLFDLTVYYVKWSSSWLLRHGVHQFVELMYTMSQKSARRPFYIDIVYINLYHHGVLCRMVVELTFATLCTSIWQIDVHNVAKVSSTTILHRHCVHQYYYFFLTFATLCTSIWQIDVHNVTKVSSTTIRKSQLDDHFT